jgi:hypothetical protein
MKEIKDLLRKLNPILKDKTDALWYLNLFSKDAKSVLKNLELTRLIADREGKIDFKEDIRLPPPLNSKLYGEYELGKVIYPDRIYSNFGLREDEFIKHILITGMTGMGKTNLTFQILNQLAIHDKPFLVFDWKKNYRMLKQIPGMKNIRVITLGDKNCNFKFNPLIPPPGIHPKHWMALLVDVIKHAFFVAHGVEYFFRKGINHLYEQYGIYEGKKDYPTFKDLEKLLQKEFVRGREMLWMSSAKRVLASLTFSGLIGETLNVRKNENIESLLNQYVIFEMDNLATIEKIFFVESLLLWIYNYLKIAGKRERFNHALIIEEAHHILSGIKERAFGEETIVESIIRMIREFGECVIAIDQEPSKISKSILANTNCKICFNLGNGNDISVMSNAMNLTNEESRFIDKLKIGHAIIKLKDRFTEPIHLKFPLMPIDKNIDQYKIKKESIGTP